MRQGIPLRSAGGDWLRQRLDAGAAVRAAQGLSTWLRGSRLGLVVMALAVGVGAGFGAVGFRWLIFAFTWLATGYQQFGQQGRVASLHLPWLGIWFLLLVPVLGGLIYGPLIQRFAREARGHGVPEVMLAVAENGGRIRPQVTVVKAVASAICIGVGGSVGREGPIVQIGSAFASTLGQLVRMSETRLRIIVACGAAGGIAATFNAPITGVFFGFEIVLREFSLDAIFATILAAVSADLVSQAFFGSGPFFAQIPHDLTVVHPATYLLVALLGLAAGLLGYGFKTVLYKFEDVADTLWRGRPEWARPAVGGVALGLLLLALPQLYGVGYPVMNQAVAGNIVLWLLVVLIVGKIVAASLTLSIGGSGGVFAPSLFTGAMAGMAFGVIVEHLFGPVVSSPAIFGVVAMGAVFGAAAQAPLTAIASVVEMTGNFTLTLPVMLAVGIASAVSKRLGHGSIYTTKLLRRGIDIERPRPTSVLQTLTVADVMQPVAQADGMELLPADVGKAPPPAPSTHKRWAEMMGSVTVTRQTQALLADETLEQALRQLTLYGRIGLPVLSPDRQHLMGWITRRGVLRTMTERLRTSGREAEQGALAAEFASADPRSQAHQPSTPLEGYQIVEITVRHRSPAVGSRLGEIAWPPECLVVAMTDNGEIVAPRSDAQLRAGERVIVLAPSAGSRRGDRMTTRPPLPPSEAGDV
ncbi:MAG: chloride channel protein [Candidatus Dormiibacterota bacterium]